MPFQILEEEKNVDKEKDKEDNILANFIILSIFIIIVLFLKFHFFYPGKLSCHHFSVYPYFIILLRLYFLFFSYYFYQAIKKC